MNKNIYILVEVTTFRKETSQMNTKKDNYDNENIA